MKYQPRRAARRRGRSGRRSRGPAPRPSPRRCWSPPSRATAPSGRATNYHPRDGWHDPERGELRGFAEHATPATATTTAAPRRSSPAATTSAARRGPRPPAPRRNHPAPRRPGPRAAHDRSGRTRAGRPHGRRIATTHFTSKRAPRTPPPACAQNGTTTPPATSPKSAPWAASTINPGPTSRATSASPRPPTPSRSTPDGPRNLAAEIVVTDGDGVQVSATRTYYDGEPEQGLPLGQVARRGLVARAETWTDGDTWLTSLRQAHDAHGNTTRIRDARDGTLERRYDAAGLFPVEERLVLPGTRSITTADLGPRASATRWPSRPRTAPPRRPSTTASAASPPRSSPATPRSARRSATAISSTAAPSARRSSPSGAASAARTKSTSRSRSSTASAARRPASRRTMPAPPPCSPRACFYDAAGAVAEKIEGVPLPAAALTPGPPSSRCPARPAPRPGATRLGRVTATRDADGFETLTRYSPLAQDEFDNEDIHPAPPYSTTPSAASDGLGHVIAQSAILPDRTHHHRYEHDAAGRLRAHIDPAGHRAATPTTARAACSASTRPTPAPSGNSSTPPASVTERRDATGARVTWTHDRLGRVLTERSYDPAGKQSARPATPTTASQDPAANAAASSPPWTTPPAASTSTTTSAAASSA
jgi:hypothetical protein